jgi:ribosomal protein S18 acetylase RimI-like enzyme
MSIKARLATLEDVERLTDYIHTQDGEPIKFLKERLLFYIKSNFVVLVEEDKKIVGRLLFQAKENPMLGVGEFEGVTVHKNYRGKGIGKLLLQKAIDSAEKYFSSYNVKLRCLYLMTRSNNTTAQKFYGKFGFKKANCIGKIYRDDQPEELVMTRFF